MNKTDFDVIIAGGGLAGLSLAKQLKQTQPELRIAIIERNQFPVPDTTAKVGESTVEIASHYFSKVLGLEEHFQQHHLRKYGLRCFFGTPQQDYAEQDELGVSELFGIPTYQIERGVLENHLYEQLRASDITIIDGANTEDIQLGNKNHSISFSTPSGQQVLHCRWLIDAAGRQALIKNKLNLQKDNDHAANAIWFRIKRKVVIDNWTEDQDWKQRLKNCGKRWLSTNHLTGAGYWVWIIPLGSEATSIGIVMDDQALAESNIQNYEDTLTWLQKEQPHCAQAIEGAELLDFKVLPNFSYGCKRVFSDQGWALTGEAGAFADPFYSPGSDFIAISNTFISELIRKDYQGEDIKLSSGLYELYYQSIFDSTLSLYVDQYGGFGDRKMMSTKLVWDIAYYWGVLSLLFFKQAIADIDLMKKLNPLMIRARTLNTTMQGHFKDRAKKRLVLPAKGAFLNQYYLPCLHQMVEALKNEEAQDVYSILEKNVKTLEALAAHLSDILREDKISEIPDDEQQLLGEYRLQIQA